MATMADNGQTGSIMSHFLNEDTMAAGGQSTKQGPRTSMVGIQQEKTEETDAHEEHDRQQLVTHPGRLQVATVENMDDMVCLQAAKQFEQQQNVNMNSVNVDMNSLNDAEKKAAIEAVVKYRVELKRAEQKRKHDNLQRAQKIRKLRTKQSELLDLKVGFENQIQKVGEHMAKCEEELQRELHHYSANSAFPAGSAIAAREPMLNAALGLLHVQH